MKIAKLFKLFIVIIIISFLGLFFVYQNGYYQNYLKNKVNLTNEMIEEFENDIKNQDNIDIKSYLKNEETYDTKIGYEYLKISNRIENIFDKGIKFIFRKLGDFVE